MTEKPTVHKNIQEVWNERNPNSPMQFGDLPYEIGSPEHREEQLKHIEQDSVANLKRLGEWPEPNHIEAARKTGYVQGVCECVAAIGDDHTLGKKLLAEMNVTKDMAKKYANPETYKTLEQGIFAPKPEQKLERAQGVKR